MTLQYISYSTITRTILLTSLVYFLNPNSLTTDGSHTLLTGTARHGLVRLWDMRDTSAHVAHYYVGHPYLGQSSPVYSVAFDQVWSLTQFYSVSFLKKNPWFAWRGKSMTPHQGNTILFRSSQQLPCLCLGHSKGFLSWHGALLGPSTCLVRCFRNYRDTRTLSGVPH